MTEDEHVAQVIRLLLRLTDHVIAAQGFQTGYRIDDVASVLRCLLGRGRGDNVVVGLARRLHLPEPVLHLGPPVLDHPDTHLAFGSLPVSSSATPQTLTTVQDQLVVVLGADGEFVGQRVTWLKLIEDYGNTWGVHVSSTVPFYLNRVNVDVSTGHVDYLPLGAFLLLTMSSRLIEAVRAHHWGRHSDVFRLVKPPEPPDSPMLRAYIRYDAGARTADCMPTLARFPTPGEVLLGTTIEGAPFSMTWLEGSRIEMRYGAASVVTDPVGIGR